MVKNLNSSILVIAILFSLNTYAQDELLFLNGKIMKGELVEKTNFEFTFKTTKGKQIVIDKYRIFSYTQKAKETIVYAYDTLAGNFLKVEEMTSFVYGERAAQYTYKPVFSSSVGLVFGVAAGYEMHQQSSFFFIGAPLAYTIGTLIFPTRVQQKRLTDNLCVGEDEYLRGYERVARSKRTQGALKSSILGLGVGFLASFIASK
jgi:hypothetical protein